MAKEETRNKILKAAEKLFSRNGYDGVPTRMIADEAGVTEMTLFNHFSNKRLLYKTVVKERYLSVEIESIFSTLTYDDLEGDLKRISKRLIDNFLDNRNIMMMRLKEKKSLQNDESFSIEKDPLLKELIPFFEAYDKEGCIKGSGRNAAIMFTASLKGLFHICLLENKSKEYINGIISNFVSIFCHGIYKKQEN